MLLVSTQWEVPTSSKHCLNSNRLGFGLHKFRKQIGFTQHQLYLALFIYLTFIYLFFIYLFILTFLFIFERQRDRVRSRGGAERAGDTESEAGSRLSAVSTEPDAGLKLTNLEIMS